MLLSIAFFAGRLCAFERTNRRTTLIVPQQNFDAPLSLVKTILALSRKAYALFKQLETLFQRQVTLFEFLNDPFQSFERRFKTFGLFVGAHEDFSMSVTSAVNLPLASLTLIESPTETSLESRKSRPSSRWAMAYPRCKTANGESASSDAAAIPSRRAPVSTVFSMAAWELLYADSYRTRASARRARSCAGARLLFRASARSVAVRKVLLASICKRCCAVLVASYASRNRPRTSSNTLDMARSWTRARALTNLYRIRRVRFWPICSMVEQIWSSRAATSSAAAEGVGARLSATKSAIVKSVSWPTADITGITDERIARATSS